MVMKIRGFFILGILAFCCFSFAGEATSYCDLDTGIVQDLDETEGQKIPYIRQAYLATEGFIFPSEILRQTEAMISREEEQSKMHKLEKFSFDKKDKEFWVLNDKESFIEASTLIDDKGNWKGEGSAPHYLKFVQELQFEDIPILLKWLSLNGLKCFAIADQKEQPNLRLILDWYNDLKEERSLEGQIKIFLYKLAWLDYKTMLHELERGDASLLPAEWVETNRAFQMKNSHYRQVETH